MSHITLQKEKLLYLESLRGIAAIIVAIFHAQFLKGSFVTESIIQYGCLMVYFFFVLSGFVIAYNYLDKIKNWQNLWVFQARRFLRLYPLHFMTLIGLIIIECAKYIFEMKTGTVANNPAFTTNDGGAVINNLFLTHSLFEEERTFNEPSWSISTEFYTYLVFALILLIPRRYVRAFFFMAMIMVGGSYDLWQPMLIPDMPGMMHNFFDCIFCFFIGVFTFLIFQKWKIQLPVVFTYLGVTACFITLPLWPVLNLTIVPLFYAFTIFSLVSTGSSWIKSFLETRFLVFLGTMSYGIYMIHETIWWIISNGLKHALKFPTVIDEVTGDRILDLTNWQVYVILIVGMTITILLSWVSYRLIEMPVNNYRHRLKMKS